MLKRQNTIFEYLILPNRSALSLTLIVPITLYSIDITVFNFPDDSNVICLSVKSVFRPIIEDNHSRRRLGRTVKPLPTLLKPIYTSGSSCVFWNNIYVNITASIGTPRNKTAAPLHAAIISVHFQ